MASTVLAPPQNALPLAAPAVTARAVDVSFSAGERALILALGPWPPAPTRDPSNRVSGLAAAVDLGRRLFADGALSRVGYIGCVTCHQPDRGLTDLRPRAHGMADVERNTPTLANLRLQRWYGWGGSSDSLWMASIRPLLDERELDSDAAIVARRFSLNDDLACRYRKVFGRAPDHADDDLLANVGKALAAFMETLVTGRTAFDAFRDALARGDRATMARYPQPAARGLKLFVGRGSCVTCHAGPTFSDDAFHRVTLSQRPPRVARPHADDGRLEGIHTVRASRFNLAGRFNDDAARGNATATLDLVVDQRMHGAFRTPSLRNAAVTAPYGHDGSIDSLHDAVQHGAADAPRPAGGVARTGRAGALHDNDVEDLVAFVRSLTDAAGELRTLPTPDPTPCR